MRQKMKYLGAVVLVLGGAGCGLPEAEGAASAGQAVEAGGKPRLAHEPSQALLDELKDVHADVVDPLDAAARAYLRVYPQMSLDQARAAAAQQEARKALYEGLVKDGDAAFGGAWFDPPAGVTHVAVTSARAAAQAARLGKELGLEVETRLVRRSFAELERQAEALRKGAGALSASARGQVGIDVTTNQVVVAVPAHQQEMWARSELPPGVTVVADPNLNVEEDYGCTSRFACDWTIRAGAALWRGSDGFVCSVGFTGRDSINRRYTLTAGHCSSGDGVNWGTGATSIGPLYAAVDTGAYDAAIIQVFNSWFTGDSGGEIYMESVSGRTVDLNGVAPTLGYIWAGDTTCLSANYTEANGPNYCGVIGTNSDAAVRGMARVDGLDACGGDSGGGWYWLTSSGRRIGYGLHSRSDSGCHGSSGGSRSWFSPLPTVKNWAPWLNVEIRP